MIRLPNDGELILTWARLLAPSGYVLNTLGVMPTICTSAARSVDSVLKRAFDSNMTHRQIAMRRIADNKDDKSREAIMTLCPWRPHEGEDIDSQVERSIQESLERL